MSTCFRVTYGQKTKVKDFASLLRKTFKELCTDILFGRKNGWVKNILLRGTLKIHSPAAESVFETFLRANLYRSGDELFF